MNEEPTHRSYGTPLSAWIMQIPAELPVDAVGLWQIIPKARHCYGLEGQELIVCVERAIAMLLDHGARPVRSGLDSGHDWIEQTQYGTEPAQITKNIISEWVTWGLGDPTAGGLWFALPELFG